MSAMHRAGQTLGEIGRAVGISPERVRQILRAAGIDAEEGGGKLARRHRIEARTRAADERYRARFGCTLAQYREIRAHGRAMRAGGASKARTPLYAYRKHRAHARARGIEWGFDLWTWWNAWLASGRWEERGPGSGYVMCRFGDLGPYAPDNVFIATGRENSSVTARKRSDLPTGVVHNGHSFVAHALVDGRRLYLGSFSNPDEAHEAYRTARSRPHEPQLVCQA